MSERDSLVQSRINSSNENVNPNSIPLTHANFTSYYSTSVSSKPSSKSNSRPTSIHGTPSLQPTNAIGSPQTHTIKLEDHRPGRQTTFSLLLGQSLPQSPKIGHASINDDLEYSIQNKHHVTTTSPYQFGDGVAGYRILFPTQELDDTENTNIQRHVKFAMWLSLIVNILLFVSKTFSAVVSHSLSVAAAAVDSFLDLASQVIVALAERGSKHHDSSLYPAGRSRLEPVGIILCAALMGMAALQLILESVEQLYQGYALGKVIEGVTFDVFSLGILVLTIIAKLGLWVYCAAYSKYSPTLDVLAVDHRNDVLSNVVALIAALLAWRWKDAWSADPIGAIVMSIYICMNWFGIGNEQIDMIVGRAADPEFIEEIRELSSTFHSSLQPDIIRAYHFGAKYLVEIEVILPAEMSVRESHDISLALQQTIEQLPAVERAFVHVDYRARPGEDEHNAKLIADLEKVKRGYSPIAEE